MKSSHKRIIRGADVEGILFCNPQGKIDKKDPQDEESQDTLKALENFCYQKGLKEGKELGSKESFEQGKQEGYQKGREEARQQGFEEGLAKGKEEKEQEIQEQWKAKYEQSLQELEKVHESLLDAKQDFLQRTKKEMGDLLIAICQKILLKKIEDPETFSTIIETLLQKAKSMAQGVPVQVLLCPEDLSLLEERLKDIHCDHHNITQLDFLSDSSMSKGCCRIESPTGILNFDIERELNELNEEFLQ